MTKIHRDTKVPLHPLTFEEAIRELAQTPKREDSEAEESDNTPKILRQTRVPARCR